MAALPQERRAVVAGGFQGQFLQTLLDLGALDLQDRAFGPRALAAALAGQGPQFGELQRGQVDLQLGDLALEEGVGQQGAAGVGQLGRGHLTDPLQATLGTRHPGDAGALVGQQRLGAGPALVLVEDAVLHRHLHIIQEDIVDLVAALQGDDRTHGDARRLHVDQQEADAGLRLGVGIGADQEEAPVGVLTERRPRLLAVDDVVFLAVLGHALGAGLQGGEVGAGTRLGIALAPPDLAVTDIGQELGFLLLGPEGVDHGRQHRDAERQDAQGVGAGLFLRPDVLLGGGPVGPAPLLGPRRRRPALLGQDAVPGEVILLAQGFAPLLLVAQGLGVVIGEEGAGLRAEGVIFGREIEVHDRAPWRFRLQRIACGRTIGKRLRLGKMTLTLASTKTPGGRQFPAM